MKITFITYSTAAVKELIIQKNALNEEYPGLIDLNLVYSGSTLNVEERAKLKENVYASDVVFFDQVGMSDTLTADLMQWIEDIKGWVLPFGRNPLMRLKLGSIDALHGKMEVIRERGNTSFNGLSDMQKKDLENYTAVSDYYTFVSKDNIRSLFLLLLREYGGRDDLPEPKKPQILDSVYYGDPETKQFYDHYEDFVKDFPMDPEKPYIGFIFYTSCYPTDTYECSTRVVRRLRQDFNVIPFGVGNDVREKYKMEPIIAGTEHPPIEVLINVKSFRLSGTPVGGNPAMGVEMLKELQVPYIKPFYFSSKSEEEWTGTLEGCSPSEVLLFIALPELDGAIETYPIGATKEMEPDEEYGIRLTEIIPIQERLEHLVDRVKRHIRLRQKKNKEKKVAILCYNYPPGENNMFGGSFLDTFASVEHMLRVLKQEGYETQDVPKEYLMDIFTTGKAVNCSNYGNDWEDMITWDDKEYSDWLSTHFDKAEMEELFGNAPGELMARNHEFLIPGTILGNVFVGLQPARCDDGGVQRAYHDKTLPPPHQYVAFYQWLEKVFQADVILHVGTHGTIELLKGKESGMTGSCYPDMLIGKIPHLYLYYTGNPSEATIAKRRTHAMLVGYQPPVFVPGELYGDYARLNENIDNYHQAEFLAPQMKEESLELIKKQARELNLPENLDDLERELYRMSSGLIPVGLHVIGKGFTEEESVEYARGLLRLSHAEAESLRSIVAAGYGEKLEELEDTGQIEEIRRIDAKADEIFDTYIGTGKLLNEDWIRDEIREALMNSLVYASEKQKASLENREMACLLNGLIGGYNEPKLAGDIFRNPECLPTGGNLYHGDPRLIPSDVAIRRGNAICENTLKAFLDDNGTYPESVAVILWGLETARTQGESFAQILSYLGIRVIKGRGAWGTRFEIIPIEELGRPRIDVTVNICGFYRDMYGNLIDTLNDLLQQLDELDETDEQNYYKKHNKQRLAELIEDGFDAKEAADLATVRMFGPKAGEYGTPLHTIVESKSWEKETDLGDIFMGAIQYAYGRTTHGDKQEGLLESNLRHVDVISQVRSNPEYEITDLDHYYEFFGGLSKSVEMVKGTKAKMYISDTTNERVYTETVEKSIARGVRTRLLNPVWIEGMLQHKVHGAQHMADRFENVTGFAATTGAVESWIYEDMFDTYIRDEEMQRKMRDNNPHAYLDILERMMELYRRGYWEATEEQLQIIRDLYLIIEGDIEEQV